MPNLFGKFAFKKTNSAELEKKKLTKLKQNKTRLNWPARNQQRCGAEVPVWRYKLVDEGRDQTADQREKQESLLDCIFGVPWDDICWDLAVYKQNWI